MVIQSVKVTLFWILICTVVFCRILVTFVLNLNNKKGSKSKQQNPSRKDALKLSKIKIATNISYKGKPELITRFVLISLTDHSF